MALIGKLRVPGDKSISHRSLIFGALATGTSCFEGLSEGEDVKSTAHCLRQMGVVISCNEQGQTLVEGVGLHGLRAAATPLDCGNSGTTFRLLMGVLAAQPFASKLVGDSSLSQRPMTRVSVPLEQLGAKIKLTDERFPPVSISSVKALSGGHYELPVASAQVKSALLLAGLYASESIVLSGRLDSRDHTENMFPAFGVNLLQKENALELPMGQSLTATHFIVPGDPSSAAFWLAAAAMVPGSQVTIENVSLNTTRTGFFEVLRRMGADIHWQVTKEQSEPIGNVSLRYAPLKGVDLTDKDIPYLVDEVPLIALLGTQATGLTSVRGAHELRVKECDRIDAMGKNLRAMGASWREFEDGFEISGAQELRAAEWLAFHDHRIAMTGVLAGLVAKSGVHKVIGEDCIAVSYPTFFEHLKQLQQ